MNNYAEYLVKKKKTLFDYTIIFLALFAGVTATISLLPMLLVQFYGMLAFLLLALVWFVIFKIISGRTIEFEYCITDNILDVDVITGQKKRKPLTSINIKEAEIIAPATVEFVNQFNRDGITAKIDATMGRNDIIDFFVLYNDENGRSCRLIFTPNQAVLDIIKRANPSNTFFE